MATPLKVSDLLTAAQKFTEGKMTVEEMDAFGNEMTIRSYLPLSEKNDCMLAILYRNALDSDITAAEKTVQIYKDKFFYGLLNKYAFIDCSEEELLTNETYDLLYPIFATFILGYCAEDYKLLDQMISDMISLDNVQNFLDAMAAIDGETLEEALKGNQALFESLKEDSDVIDKLADIARFNDPTIADLADAIKEEALERK